MKKKYGDRTIYEAFSTDGEYLEMLESCMEMSEIGFLIADAEGKVIKINKAQIDITGQDASYNIGRNMREVELDDQSPSATVIVCDTKKPVKLEQQLPNGNSYLVYSNPIFDDDGKLKYVVSNLIDATEIRETRESLRREQNSNMQLNLQVLELQNQMEENTKIVHQSRIMRQVLLLCNKVAPFDSNILVEGESGVGKEKIAEYIVWRSGRKTKPFIKINCAAIPEQLMESELFGYEPGAFTNANVKGKKGLLEYAHEGTMLLDEISELAMPLQAKLLRFLQEGEFYRIGGIKPIKANVRIIATTNNSLPEMIKEGNFREDLYYRLNVVPVTVPPLRERKEDIPLLAGYFVNKLNEKYDIKKKIDIKTANILKEFHFSGNVRELQNTIERLMVLSEGDSIGPEEILKYMKETNDIPEGNGQTFKELMKAHERNILEYFLNIFGNQVLMGEALKISQSTISRKLTEHGLVG